MSQIVTRFAPSPTGHMHTGSYRTAFFAYLFARKNNGKFILRIEDTDRNRYKPEYTDEIFKVFEIIGIPYDESYIQSENLPRHREMLQKLIDEDKAYISREEAKDGSGVIKDIIRFRNPGKVVTFTDLIRGEISTDTTDLGDFVIAKNIDEPLFHLAVVVDDHDEGINHVIRTDEHVANTPRQILIHEALGFPLPQYVHLPLVLAPDRTKMSKRNGAIPVIEYLNRGYLPAALLNAICLCGWNPGTEQELFTRDELEKVFDLDHVQKGGAIFNEEKLNWFNREYMKKMSSEELKTGIMKFLPDQFKNLSDEIMNKLIPIIAERINYFGEVQIMIDDGELDYYINTPEINLEKLSWKGEGNDKAKIHLEKTIELLDSVSESDWNSETVKNTIWSYAEESGRGNVLWPMRFALSGRDKSPDPFTLADILGKETTLGRLKQVINQI
jgi:glutamyl-tRNA synthetase